MPSIPYVDNRRAIQYTGSNSAEIDTEIPNFTVVSEAGGVLTFDSSSPGWVANTGDWIAYTQGNVSGVFADADFFTFYVQGLLADDLTALAADVDALDGRLDTVEAALTAVGSAAVRSAGVASAGTLLLNTPVNVAVQLIPAMADSSYNAYAYIFGTGVNLGQVTINSVTVTDSDTVTVNVQTSAWCPYRVCTSWSSRRIRLLRKLSPSTE